MVQSSRPFQPCSICQDPLACAVVMAMVPSEDFGPSAGRLLFDRFKFPISAMLLLVGLVVAGQTHGQTAVAFGALAFAGALLLVTACLVRTHEETSDERHAPLREPHKSQLSAR